MVTGTGHDVPVTAATTSPAMPDPPMPVNTSPRGRPSATTAP